MEDRKNTKNYGSFALNIISYAFGTLAFAIGLVNTFWGQPVGFGIFIIILSISFFLPINAMLKRLVGFKISRIGLFRVLLAILSYGIFRRRRVIQ